MEVNNFQANIVKIVKQIEEEKLSHTDLVKLVTSLLVIEYQAPILQKDGAKRDKVFQSMLTLVLTKYFTPSSALTILSTIALEIFKNNPDLTTPTENESSYVT